MKTKSKITFKALIVAMTFVFGTLGATAQSTARNAGLIISKDVHRVANKKLYQENSHQKELKTKSVGSTWVQSKAVHRRFHETPRRVNNIESKGTPSWVNAKPVHRKTKELEVISIDATSAAQE